MLLEGHLEKAKIFVFFGTITPDFFSPTPKTKNHGLFGFEDVWFQTAFQKFSKPGVFLRNSKSCCFKN